MSDVKFEKHAPQDLMDAPFSEILKDAIDQWQDLTGKRFDDTRFSFGSLDLKHMNDNLLRMLELEPEGRTALMLLEIFLREYLESKSFTAAQIMRDYAQMMEFLRKAETLFSIVQSDRAAAEMASFRQRVLAGLQHYQITAPETIEMAQGGDVLAFLRRDALESSETLTAFQFLKGRPAGGVAQVIEHVYIAWDINELLIGLRDMPVNGIAVVLLRDPSNPDRSYFCFGMRNGENVTLFTDKSRPAYPGQDDVLAGRGGRGVGRRFAERAWANHFPYQLIKTTTDPETGDIRFERERLPVMSGASLQPLMRIADLPAHQAIWITMMLSLIQERFWVQNWQAEALSYSGQMIRQKDLLCADRAGGALSLASDYQEISLDPVCLEEVTSEAMEAQTGKDGRGVNAWLEARYRDAAPQEILNVWHAAPDETLMLPDLRPPSSRMERDPWKELGSDLVKHLPGGISAVKLDKVSHWSKPRGYNLLSFNPQGFGTQEQLEKDRIYVARHNLAMFIQKSADEEYAARKQEVMTWYLKAINENHEGLIRLLAHHLAGQSPFEKIQFSYRPLDHFKLKSQDSGYTRYPQNLIGEPDSKAKFGHACLLTGASSTEWRTDFVPRVAQDICLLTGQSLADLPDVLQNWASEKRDYVGNHLLDRVDPVVSQIHDPWMKLQLNVTFLLSKRGKSMVEKIAARIDPEAHAPEGQEITP